MRGHLGQFVLVIPDDNLMVVRLGRTQGARGEDGFPREIDLYLKEAYKMTYDAT